MERPPFVGSYPTTGGSNGKRARISEQCQKPSPIAQENLRPLLLRLLYDQD